MQGFRSYNRRGQNDVSELDSARSKLEGYLQNLMEKTDESPSSSEDEGNKRSPEHHTKELSPVVSPTKKPAQRIQRKRRRKDDGSAKNSNSCVLKLYDRSVNLAPFAENTPLYPVCRAWIKNEPTESPPPAPERTPTPISEGEDEGSKDSTKVKNIYHLPPPKERIKVENGDSHDPYIPLPLPKEENEEFVINSSGEAPCREMLLAKHMARWRAVRQKWKEAAAAKEERYGESCTILKSMFERHYKEKWEKLANEKRNYKASERKPAIKKHDPRNRSKQPVFYIVQYIPIPHYVLQN